MKEKVINDDEFIKGKAESIIEYMVDNVENVEDGDITVEEVVKLPEASGTAEEIATGILDHVAEDIRDWIMTMMMFTR